MGRRIKENETETETRGLENCLLENLSADVRF